MSNYLQFPYQALIKVKTSFIDGADVEATFYENSLILSLLKTKDSLNIEYDNISFMSKKGNELTLILKKSIGVFKNVTLLIDSNDNTTQQYIENIQCIVEENRKNLSVATNDHHISLALHIVLLLFTCGIWQLIWVYKTTDILNAVTSESYRSPISNLLLFMFVPFYSIYWIYQSAKRIDTISNERGKTSDFATVSLILSIFIPIVAIILMQDKINQAFDSNTQL